MCVSMVRKRIMYSARHFCFDSLYSMKYSEFSIIRTVLLIPLMISGISVTMLFKVMLDNMFGIIPYLLSFIGLKSDFFGS